MNIRGMSFNQWKTALSFSSAHETSAESDAGSSPAGPGLDAVLTEDGFKIMHLGYRS